jgi:hypothetical protein
MLKNLLSADAEPPSGFDEEHPKSRVARSISEPLAKRLLMNALPGLENDSRMMACRPERAPHVPVGRNANLSEPPH